MGRFQMVDSKVIKKNYLIFFAAMSVAVLISSIVTFFTLENFDSKKNESCKKSSINECELLPMRFHVKLLYEFKDKKTPPPLLKKRGV